MWKNHRLWFVVFSTVSVLSLGDIASRSMGITGDPDTGTVSIGLALILAAPFGYISKPLMGVLFPIYAMILNMVFSFAILWVPIAFYEYKQMRKTGGPLLPKVEIRWKK